MQVSAQDLKEKYGSHCEVRMYCTTSETPPAPKKITSINQVQILEQLGPQPDIKTKNTDLSANGLIRLHYPDVTTAQNSLQPFVTARLNGLTIDKSAVEEPKLLPDTLNAPIALEQDQTLFSLTVKALADKPIEMSQFEVTDVSPKFFPHHSYYPAEAREKGLDVGFWYTSDEHTFLSFQDNANPYDPKNFICLDQHFNGQNTTLLFLTKHARNEWKDAALYLMFAAVNFQKKSGFEPGDNITRLVMDSAFKP